MNSNQKRLFIIANPTHFVTIKNYIEKYPGGENYVVLTIRYFDGYEDLYERVKYDKSFELLETFYIDQSKKSISGYLDIFKKLRAVGKLKRTYNYFDEICFTNYGSWLQNYIVQQFRTKKVILISDGTAIFKIIDLRMENRNFPFSGNKFFIDKILKLTPIENLHFYSQINVEVAKFDSLEIFTFKSSSTSRVNDKKIYFVGGPLVELNLLHSQHNLEYLKLIKDRFKDYEIFYFAHRREKEKNLNEYDFFGKIIRDSIPFEERMENEKELPGIVISYISSVLINLPQVYPEVQFYYLPLVTEDIPSESALASNYFPLKENFKKVKSINFSEFKID